MIPGRNKTRYKYLTRVQLDLWNTLKTKSLKKKKWRPVIRRIKKQRPIPRLLDYIVKPLSKFPVYHRYYYKNTLFIKQGLKLFFGGLQDYRIKALVLRTKVRGHSLTHIRREFDEKLSSFLYNLKLAKTISEAEYFVIKKYVFVIGKDHKLSIKIGDRLSFNHSIEKIFRRRLKRKELNYLPFEIDIDPQSLHFHYINEIKVFWHPFMHKFQRPIQWYSI